MSSWLPLPPATDFSLHNLPYGIFRAPNLPPRVGVAIGDHVLDLAALADANLLSALPFDARPIFTQNTLNPFMDLGQAAWRSTRQHIQSLLAADNPALRDNAALRHAAVVPRSAVELLLPAAIGDYTDFYSSFHHAYNLGVMLRGPDNALMPNWKHLPVAYHGRASSIVVSGTNIQRPHGQIKPPDAAPVFAPARNLDFELETGFLVGGGNNLGEPIPIAAADAHMFGMVLVNDWSARDLQTWEYQPLGPFLAKNFATSISPWVVTFDALEPFKRPLPPQDPPLLPYLARADDWLYDIHLEVSLQTASMSEPFVISHSNVMHLYWSMNQQLAHHTVNGCNLRTGDLLASGTLSGPAPNSYGSLIELTRRGAQPLHLPDGETRAFLHDGDRVTFHGWAEQDGIRVGFGSVTAQILPASS